jgi:hypothetical protein
MTERPFTQKSSFGQESVNNTILDSIQIFQPKFHSLRV